MSQRRLLFKLLLLIPIVWICFLIFSNVNQGNKSAIVKNRTERAPPPLRTSSFHDDKHLRTSTIFNRIYKDEVNTENVIKHHGHHKNNDIKQELPIVDDRDNELYDKFFDYPDTTLSNFLEPTTEEILIEEPVLQKSSNKF